MNDINLRMERLALLIGQMIGQIAELLNRISGNKLSNSEIYRSLLDIEQAAALQIHDLYYKHNSESKE